LVDISAYQLKLGRHDDAPQHVGDARDRGRLTGEFDQAS
jgi:hypothetical protein